MARAVTVRVFQKAVEELADDPNDPVNEVLDGLAEQVRELALENARKIIPTLPENFLTVTTGKDSKGLFFRVEPDGVGRLSAYLTWKEFREQAWLAPAIADVVGQGSIRRAGVQARRRTFPRGAGFTI